MRDLPQVWSSEELGRVSTGKSFGNTNESNNLDHAELIMMQQIWKTIQFLEIALEQWQVKYHFSSLKIGWQCSRSQKMLKIVDANVQWISKVKVFHKSWPLDRISSYTVSSLFRHYSIDDVLSRGSIRLQLLPVDPQTLWQRVAVKPLPLLSLVMVRVLLPSLKNHLDMMELQSNGWRSQKQMSERMDKNTRKTNVKQIWNSE